MPPEPTTGNSASATMVASTSRSFTLEGYGIPTNAGSGDADRQADSPPRAPARRPPAGPVHRATLSRCRRPTGSISSRSRIDAEVKYGRRCSTLSPKGLAAARFRSGRERRLLALGPATIEDFPVKSPLWKP